jgi:Phosphopantetheine attachment site
VPNFIVPPLGAMVLLNDLPLTSPGKVDRAQLPHLGMAEESGNEGAAPRDRIVDIWTGGSVRAEISPADNSLEIGGHSLLAIQVVSESIDTFGIDVPLSTLLRGASLDSFTLGVKDT